MLENLRKKMLHSFLNIDGLLKIRTDFFEIYRHTVKHPKILKKVKNDRDYWYNCALTKGVHAEYFDPYKGLFKIFSIIRWIIRLFGFIGISYSFSKRTVILPVVGPVVLWVLLELYLWLLSRNRELYQFANKHLKFQIGELQKFKRQGLEEIYSAAIWNQSLSNSITLPILQFLLIIKYISRSIYQLIIDGLKRFTHSYLDSNGSIKETAFDSFRWAKRRITEKKP